MTFCCWIHSSTPAPGSKEAGEQGCTCPVLDNNHGNGDPWPREDGLSPLKHPKYWITAGCPLHDLTQPEETE